MAVESLLTEYCSPPIKWPPPGNGQWPLIEGWRLIEVIEGPFNRGDFDNWLPNRGSTVSGRHHISEEY